MSNLSFNPQFADTLGNTYLAARKTISTSQILAAVGVSNATSRQTVLVYNTSSTVTVFFGPTGVTAATTGIPIEPGNSIRVDADEEVSVYLITSTGSADVVIQELG